MTPCACSYSGFSFCRSATTRDMSTSIALVTCAEVSSERRMCSGDAAPHRRHRLELLAGHERRLGLGGRLRPAARSAQAPAAEQRARELVREAQRPEEPRLAGAGSGSGAGAGAGGATCGAAGAGSTAAGGAAAGAAAAPDSMNARMSFFVTRPPVPVPVTGGRVDAVLGRDARDDRGDEAPAVPGGSGSSRCGSGRGRRRRRRSGRRRCGGRLGGRSGCDGLAGAGSGAGSGSAGAGSAGAGSPGPRRSRRPRARSARSRSRPRRSRLPGRGSRRRRPRRGSAPRCRPCRWRSRAAARRGRSCSPSLLEPLRDRALGDGHAHLGHHDLGLRSCRHVSSSMGRRARPSRRRAPGARPRRPRPAGCTPSRAGARTGPACRVRRCA